MDEPLVSVIMSSYNESANEIEQSIDSVIEQTYRNIEIIIIDDNPANDMLREKLNSITDSRVHVIFNEKNIGLIKSLNKALEYAQGEYIVRMDADDICIPTRIKDEMQYLLESNADLIGSYVTLIDEHGFVVKSTMKLPISNNKIKRYMKWGSCVCHPTWLVKREVYKKLGGYRKVPNCEDYDFLQRAIKEGFILGNIPKVELKYRVRKTGISQANADDQYLLRDYLAHCNSHGDDLSEEEIKKYLTSQTFFQNKKQLEKYHILKHEIKNKDYVVKAKALLRMPVNPYFWKDIIEKIMLKVREEL
ncbi:MAG: glycosyltransferase [Oribacterium sp.]|nr:glycosyltransferase [Oribacterium sp.]